MRKLYGAPPPDEAITMSLWGATPGEVSPPVKVWPDVWPVLDVFSKCGTQWRTGVNGVFGLDYSVLPWLFEMCDVPNHKRAFKDIQTMERIALEEMAG